MFVTAKAKTKGKADGNDEEGQDTPQAKAPKVSGSWSGAKNVLEKEEKARVMEAKVEKARVMKEKAKVMEEEQAR
eukprot:9765034-Heterocapsa_arctica.AAC.1